MKITKEYLYKEYITSKQIAIEAYKKNKINKSLVYFEYASSICWRYPILKKFIDEEIENYLTEISKKTIPKEPEFYGKSKRIVFYNGQFVNSGALTEQYLNYFIENNFKVLIIVSRKKNCVLGENIIKRIEACPNTELFIPKVTNKIRKIKQIRKKIYDFNPGKAFLHFLPNDVVGFCSFVNFKNLERFYIVHNDHTFWLGKNCSDYFIEFRKFGYLLAIQRRGIDFNKIYHLPYYPIIQNAKFQGFPFNPTNKVIGFSGANLYKYLLDPELKFFYAIKELILRNKNFVFCLAGYGNVQVITNFIKQNNLENKFYFLGKRDDFYSLVANIDILFESYPFKGGLTVLYGTENHKAIVGIGNNKNASGCIEDMLDIKEYHQPQNIPDFIEEADSLIKNEELRKKNADLFSKNKFNKIDFDCGLKKILTGELPSKTPIYNETLKLDDDYFLDEYLNMPNANFDYYYTKIMFLKKQLKIGEKISIIKFLFKKKLSLKKQIKLILTLLY